MEESLHANTAIIQKNLTTMDERMKALAAKMDKLGART
jgi:hypothetical protein